MPPPPPRGEGPWAQSRIETFAKNTPLADFGLGPDPLLDKVAFPQLSEVELSEVALFGERRSFAKDEPLFCAGDYPFNSYAILSEQSAS